MEIHSIVDFVFVIPIWILNNLFSTAQNFSNQWANPRLNITDILTIPYQWDSVRLISESFSKGEEIPEILKFRSF